jgi:hypothetical protein
VHGVGGMTHAQEVSALLGDVDPLIIERVVETGASTDEIAEALSQLSDEPFEARTAPSSSRVVEVRAILAELLEDTDDEDSVLTWSQVT